jgi:hypothetical protein
MHTAADTNSDFTMITEEVFLLRVAVVSAYVDDIVFVVVVVSVLVVVVGCL